MPGRRTPGQFPLRTRRGKGPSRPESFHTPYKRPARTPVSTANRPTLLSSPATLNKSAGTPSSSTPDLGEICTTLSNLVSRLNSMIDGLSYMRKRPQQPCLPSRNPIGCDLYVSNGRVSANVRDPPEKSLSTCGMYGLDVRNVTTNVALPDSVDVCKLCV